MKGVKVRRWEYERDGSVMEVNWPMSLEISSGD